VAWAQGQARGARLWLYQKSLPKKVHAAAHFPRQSFRRRAYTLDVASAAERPKSEKRALTSQGGFMKHFLIFIAFMVAGLCSISASAAEQVTVTLSNPTDPIDAQSGKIIFTIKNEGDTNVTISKYKIPNFTTGELSGNDFTIVSTYSGQEAPYTGWLVKPGPLVDDDFIVMAPGEVKTVMVDLNKFYNNLGGTHTVTFTLQLGQFSDATPPVSDPQPGDPRLPREVVSNTLTITMIPSQPNALPAKYHDLKLSGIKSKLIIPGGYTVVEYFENPGDQRTCTDTQLTQVQSAANEAYLLAKRANYTRVSMYSGSGRSLRPFIAVRCDVRDIFWCPCRSRSGSRLHR
jgi:archaellum component FlaG (FlaF/FlaG flagellin family)